MTSAEPIEKYCETKSFAGQSSSRLIASKYSYIASPDTWIISNAFRDSVMAERGWEFAAECGIRWFDLVRTETVQKANSIRDASEVSLANQPSDANHTYYWAPIPAIK